MKLKNLSLIAIALLIQCPLLAQKKELPVVRSNSVRIDIKDDNVLKKSYWTIVPELEIDVYTTKGKKVTFYTDVDSISFNINPKIKEYDFIIVLNEKDSARTQIRYEQSDQDRNEWIKRHLANSFDLFYITSTHKTNHFNHGRGFRHSFSYKFPFGKSNYALGMGVGIGFYNYYSKPENNTKKSKVMLSYFDVPLELMYRSKKGFRFSAGTKIDFIVNSFSKYKGADYLFGSNEDIKFKKYPVEHLSPVLFGPMVRIGWHMLNIYATYSITSVYDSNAGCKLNPVSIGISLTPVLK